MGRRKMRISGTGLKSAEGLAYARQSADGFELDIGAVQRHVKAYLAEAAEAGRYSVAGLCIALGVTRATLGLWRRGYICRADMGDERVVPNEALADCIEMALLHLQRHWEECDKPSSLNVKQLEALGALGESGERGPMPPFDLGKLKKYAR